MDSFFDSAIRHWEDGRILLREERYDNAVCLFGLSVECALKNMLDLVYAGQIDLKQAYSHNIEQAFDDLYLLLANLLEMLLFDSAFGLKFSQYNFQGVLLQDHPERRYFETGTYGFRDAVDCEKTAASLVKELIMMHIDGYN